MDLSEIPGFAVARDVFAPGAAAGTKGKKAAKFFSDMTGINADLREVGPFLRSRSKIVHHQFWSFTVAQEIKKAEAGVAPARRYYDPFAAMRSEMERVFDTFLGGGFGRFPMLSRAAEKDFVVPSIDVHETDTELVVEAELPGMDEKDVSVTLSNGVLTLKGEKKSEREEKKEDYHLMERSYGSFQRSFQVADSVDPDNVKASFDKGILKITMPKRPEVVKAEKRIPIGKG